MAVNIPTTKPKTILYKMVTVPKVKVTPQNSATVTSYKAFTTGLNRLGATINSMIVLQKRTNDALLGSLKLKAKEAEEDRKQYERNRRNDKKGSGLGKLATNVTKAAAFVVGDFFESVLGLFQSILRVVVTQSILRWLANPANREKLTVIWNAMVGFFKFLWDFISTNIGKTLSGLSDMLNSNLGFWDRLKGFGTFLVGFGSLLLGFAFLKKPKLLLDGVKFVLKTVWDSVSGLVKLLGGRKNKASTGTSRPGSPGPKGSTPDAGGRPRGRAGALMKGLGAVSMIAAPIVVGGMLGGGESEFQKSVTGDTSGGQPGPDAFSSTPQLAQGGIISKPTQALVGERGPEARIPLLSKSQNAKNMAASGISPLPGGGFDRKKAKSLSDLYMAPFKGIGAGILANISSVVGQIPGSGATKEVLTNIVAPIANSFGVPASLVKKLTGKSVGGTSDKSKKGISFGKGITSNQGDKFQRKGDNSVLGLLSDLVGAGQVLNNKLNKKKGTGTGTKPPDTTPGEGAKEDSADASSSSAVEAANQGKGSQDLSKGTVGASQATQQGQSSDQRQNFDSSNAKANRHNLPFKGPDGVTNYEAKLNVTNGDYEVWKHNGILGWERLDISKDKNTLQKQKAFNQVRAFYIKHAQQQGLNLNYITQDDVKRRQELIKKYDAEIKSKGVDSSAPYRNKPPKKAGGGWISGPQSGYPVSLDGGGSTSFIGHGTEWVGFKKAMGGKSGTDAFVIPFDTPATKNNKGLTNSRMTQAKSGGYALPTFAKGGTTNAPNWKGDTGPNSRWNLVATDKSKETVRKRLKNKFADGGKIAEAAKSMVGQYFGPDGCAKSTRAMLAKAGVAPNPLVTKKILDPGTNGALPTGTLRANSFGSDQGAVIKSSGKVQAGDVVLWDTGGGEIGHVGVAIGNGQVVHNSSSAGYKLAKMGISGMKFHSAVRLGATSAATGTDPASVAAASGTGGGTGGGGDSTDAGILAEMASSIDKLNAMREINPSPDASTSAVSQSTASVSTEKDKLKTLSKQTAAAIAATAYQQAATSKATTGSAVAQVPTSQPIILPSKPVGIPVTYLFPKTGMLTNTTSLAFGL